MPINPGARMFVIFALDQPQPLCSLLRLIATREVLYIAAHKQLARLTFGLDGGARVLEHYC